MDMFITLSILVNTFFMALDHHNMNQGLKEVASAANGVCAVVLLFVCLFLV